MGKAIIGLLVALAVGALMFLGTYNGIVGKDENVNEKYGTLQADLQRRADLIPNLVNTVKAYAKQEEKIFTEIADARTEIGGLAKIDAKELAESPELQQQLAEAQAGMNSALSRLLAIAEAYPELKSGENFSRLQAQLEGTENRLKTSRRDVQLAVADYNKSVRTFPGNIVAGFSGFKAKPFYQADEGVETVPEVTFDE